MRRINKNEILLEREGPMKVEARIYARENINLESRAIDQLKDAACLPSVEAVCATPDLHEGYGVPIGSIVGTREVICPAAVGYDINCGMRLLSTNLTFPKFTKLEEIVHSIHRDIPLGEGKHNVEVTRDEFNQLLNEGVKGLLKLVRMKSASVSHRVFDGWDEREENYNLSRIEENGSMTGDCSAVSARAKDRGLSQLGTIGGGNHFIEFQLVDKIFNEKTAEKFGLFLDQIVIMLHTGSRGMGHQVGDEFMKIAVEYDNQHGLDYINRELAYLPVESAEGKRYIRAMNSAANFAFVNRHLLGRFIIRNLKYFYPDAEVKLVYDVPHNMAKLETHFGKQLWVHRKGATRAFDGTLMNSYPFSETGQPVLIPGSMGTASYVLVGIRENARTMRSVNHGAGRTMSRTAASGRNRRGRNVKEAAVSDEAFAKAMEGILLVCENKKTIKEEAPQAYKDIDAVIETVVDARLADVVARLKPIAVLKG